MSPSIQKKSALGFAFALITAVLLLAAGWLAMPRIFAFTVPPSPSPIPTFAPVPTSIAFLHSSNAAISILPAPAVFPPTLALAQTPFHRLPELARFGDGWPASAAYSADGKWMALGGSVGATIFRTADWTTVESIPSASPVLALAFSPDGRWLAMGKQDGNIQLLDPQTWSTLDTLFTRNSPVRSIAFPWLDETDAIDSLAAGYQNGTIVVWDLVLHSPRLQVGDPLLGYWGYGIRSLAYSPHNYWLAAGGDQGYISSWRLSDGQLQPHIQTQHGLLFGISFSKFEWLLASACSDGSVQLWEYTTGRPLFKLEGHTYGAWSVAIAPDGKTVAVGAGDGSLHLWDTLTGNELGSAIIADGSIDQLAFSPDGAFLTAISVGKKAVALRADSLVSAHDFSTHRGAFRSAAFSSDGSTALLTGETGALYLWDLRIGSAYLFGPEHLASNAGMSAMFSPDDRQFAVADGALNRMRIYQTADSSLVQDFPLSKARAAAFDPTGQWLAGAGRELILLDRDTGTEQRFPLLGNATSLAFLSLDDGTQQLAAGLDTGAVDLWDISTGAITELQPAGGEPVFALAGAGRWLAVADYGGTITVWDIASLKIQYRLHLNGAPALSLAFHPGASLLAAGSLDGTITIWNMADGSVRATIPGHAGWVNGIAFSSDGAMLLSAGADGTARIWGIISR
jgi:WD40 repeat protein